MLSQYLEDCTKFMQKSTAFPRPIRSYVLRQGRITKAQSEALANPHSSFLLSPEIPLQNGEAVFERLAPITLEIGFGMGDSLLAMAQQNPEQNFIGIEVHAPGVGRLLHRMELEAIHNVRIYHADAVEVLKTLIAPESLSRVCVFFPDPWTKKRHHKRRIIQKPFIETIASVLKIGGDFHLATDVEDYAMWMQEMLESSPLFENRYGPKAFAPQSLRPETKFERRGIAIGHGIWDLVYKKCNKTAG